jgi:integrase
MSEDLEAAANGDMTFAGNVGLDPSNGPAVLAHPGPGTRRLVLMQSHSLPVGPKRDTGWKRDGRAKGIYWRKRANGSKAWGFYADGNIQSAPTRQAAIDEKARAALRKSAGLPAPNTRVTIADLAEEIREGKRRKLRSTSFAAFEYALDKVVLPEIGHLKPGQAGPDRIARFIRDLEDRGLAPSTIRRYLTPLSAIFKLAVRRGVIPSSPLAQLADEERPTGGGIRDHYVWSPEEISKLIAAAGDLGCREKARYDYAPLIHLLALTGLRVSEALALRWCDADLLEGVLSIRHSWSREGFLTAPKTEAGVREVPLSPGLVDLLVQLKPPNASDENFFFASKGSDRPISYWNFRRRGFEKAIERAGLDGRGITIHDLRSAAASLYAAKGLTHVEVAEVLGHSDSNVTLRVYTKLFDKRDVAERVRAAQASLSVE